MHQKLTRRLTSKHIILSSLLSLLFSLWAIYAVSADTFHVSKAKITVSAACSMAGTVDVSHIETISAATYSSEIGKTTIKTFCNDTNGYAIYAIGYTGDSYTGTNQTKLVGASTGATIDTGTATSGATSAWAMKLTKVTNPVSEPGITFNPTNLTITNGFDNYSAVPSTFTKVVDYSSTTDTVLGSSIETTYAAYVSGTQAADTYTGKVKYVLVHPNSNVAGLYSIAYNANGGSGTMASSTDLYNFEPFTLPNHTYTVPGNYAFVGWCTSGTSQNTCTDGYLYQPGDVVTSLGSAGETVTLYAIWDVLSTMQTFTPADAAALSVGESTTLYDARDNREYTVAKFADGKVWMTSDLNLAGGSVIEGTLSDVPLGYTLSTNNGFQSGNRLPESSTSGFLNSATAYVYNSGNTTDCGDYGQNYPCNSYYSWTAATAGSGVNIMTTNMNAPYSICPKGWKIPTTYYGEDSESDIRALLIALGGSSAINSYDNYTVPNSNELYVSLHASPYKFLFSGEYENSRYYPGYNSGTYWTATNSVDGYNFAFAFYIGSHYVNSTFNEGRELGYPLRCLFKGP